jgi:chromosome segregation ATPase
MKFPTNLSFQRLSSFPLDDSCIFENYEQLENYVNNESRVYIGQVVFVREVNAVYFVSADKEIIKLLASNEQLDLSSIQNALDTINADLTELETNMNSRITDLDNSIENINNNYEQIQTNIDSINENVSDLSDQLTIEAKRVIIALDRSSANQKNIEQLLEDINTLEEGQENIQNYVDEKTAETIDNSIRIQDYCIEKMQESSDAVYEAERRLDDKVNWCVSLQTDLEILVEETYLDEVRDFQDSVTHLSERYEEEAANIGEMFFDMEQKYNALDQIKEDAIEATQIVHDMMNEMPETFVTRGEFLYDINQAGKVLSSYVDTDKGQLDLMWIDNHLSEEKVMQYDETFIDLYSKLSDMEALHVLDTYRPNPSSNISIKPGTVFFNTEDKHAEWFDGNHWHNFCSGTVIEIVTEEDIDNAFNSVFNDTL